MRRLTTAALVGVALLAGACTSTDPATETSSGSSAPATSAPDDGAGNAEVDAYCEAVAEHSDELSADVDPTSDDEFDAWYDAVLDISQFVPGDIADEFDDLVAIFGDLQAAPADERLDALLELDQEEVTSLMDAVDSFTLEECGFTFDGEDESTTPSFDDEPTTSGTEDEDPLSTDAMDAFLEDNYGNESWYEKINTWSIYGGGDDATVSVGTDSGFTDAEALSACEALAEWLYGVADDGAVEIYEGEVVVAQRDSVADACDNA